DQLGTIVRLVKLKEPKKAPLIDGFYIIDLWELKKTTVELIATRTKQFKDIWEEKRRLRWPELAQRQQSSSQSTPPVPLSIQSSSVQAAPAKKFPPLPKLILRLEDGLTEEKPKAAIKRKAADENKENKRPRIQTDLRLRRALGKKEPKVAQNKKDDDKRFKENVRRAKLAMEKRQREKDEIGWANQQSWHQDIYTPCASQFIYATEYPHLMQLRALEAELHSKIPGSSPRPGHAPFINSARDELVPVTETFIAEFPLDL
ncbi:hypothetical protein AVEN_228120-1, partial [Araneus ventricosus]